MIDSNPPSADTCISGLLGVSFVVLKLTGVIGWSWWYVTMPFWGGAAICFVGFGGYLLISATRQYFENRKQLKLSTARRITEIEILDVVVEERKLARKLEDPYMQAALIEVEKICS